MEKVKVWDKKYAARLLKLAAFLEKLPRASFNFDVIRKVNCKSQACALGYCTNVFKKDWRVHEKPYLSDIDYDGKVLYELVEVAS